MKMKTKVCLLAVALGLGLAQHHCQMKRGRTSIVHLFEWRWADVAQECERYLAPNGYGGVQISPPSENIVVTKPWRPWWERYQPVSHNLCSRSGTEQELRDMITRCNAVGDFNDQKCRTRSGNIENYQDIYQVRDCRLLGLLDLAHRREHVRQKVAEYMNALIDLGVAGFRVDACKHIWPEDLHVIYSRLHNLNTTWFPAGSKPFIYQEVIDLGGEPIKASEYDEMGRVTEFKYGARLGTVIRKWNGEKLSDLKNWGEDCGLMASEKALVFLDNHDNQRGHGAGGTSILTFWEPRLYRLAMGFMLAHPYGMTRVMSSYRWNRQIVDGKDQNDWMGPPSFPDGSTKPVHITPDGECGDGWVCEHRWHQIRNMVIFRNVVNGQPLCNWWDNGSNQIAFGRGNHGFIVINNDDWTLDEILNTGLASGTYCDVISGQKEGGRCTGKQVTVGEDGKAHFRIKCSDPDPFFAIHMNSKL
ncbi:alpha-amylase 2B-like isoform X3 [Anguilla anguilla]|uniref:alpha-amylase 2B-like isoform X3 n=1 Tax=Anguilla anguilla TaxID=7936 RepID=UPI0015AEF190|nr:alpha-amylase 2B-like isoform X3 [Anguilla anguilla]